jgi:hypothetical protein
MEDIGNSLAPKVSNPWQDRGSLGFFKAFWGTIKCVLLKPGEFFDNFQIQASLKEPYLFYLVISWCVGIVSVVTGILLKPKGSPSIFKSLVIFLLISIGIFIWSGILHLGVMLLGGKGGFKGTFNVLAYNTSTNIFLIIPFVGGMISGVWGSIVGVKGFKRVHHLSTLKAIIAYFGIFLMVVLIVSFVILKIYAKIHTS